MLTSTGGWAPAVVVAGQEAVPPLTSDTSPALLAPGLKDVLDSPLAQAAGSASGRVDPLDSARASHGACQPPASTSALRKSISMGDGLQRGGKTRRVSLLVGDVAVAPAAEDAEPRKDQQMELSLETTSQQSSKSFASQKGRNRRSRLMMPGGKSVAEDSIDDMAALATDSRWFSFRPKVIMPNDGYYMIFWYFTMAFAMANAILDPFDLAFGSTRGWEASQIDFWAAVDFIGTVVFLVDIVLKFFLAYEDEERKEMVTEFKPIAKHYLSFMFWMDVLFWFPFVGVILTLRPDLADGPPPPDDVNIPDAAISAGYYVGLLGFLKLGRLYRIFHLFDHLDHTMIISQMSLMLLRNFVYIMLTCHWSACIFYFIGRAEQYSVTGSWMGRHLERFQGLTIGEVYIYSFYLSVNTFAGLGDGDFFSGSPVESVVMSIYLLFNVVLGAYILGTVTMLMVKGDERSKSYRDRISHLKDYYVINELPKELHDAMRAHLELHYQSEQVADEAVLSMYPSAIRRKVLRHLYLEPLRNCYLFKSCKPKFLDAVLANCRTDLFMPNVHLINEGDIVSELYMMIEGEVEVHSAAMRRAHAQAQAREVANQRSLDRGSASTDAGSVNSKSYTPSTVGAQSQATSGMSLLRQNSLAMSAVRTHIDRRSTSECFGEVAFFTEVPSTDSIWTVSVVRLLVLPRQAYTNLVTAYPNQVRSLVDELRKKSERDVLDLLSDTLDSMPDGPDSIHTQIEPWAPDGQLTTLAIPAPLMRELRGALPEEQAAKLAQLERVKTAVQSFCLKQDWHRVYEMLNAASKGEDDTIKTLMSQGVSAACTDCDARTPLILAAQEGKESTVKLLLSSGANPNALDVFGNSALISAIKHGHDYLIETLVAAGATLAGVSDIILTDLFESVMEGDLAKLVRYLRGRADPSMPNHDGRTPLHMAAAEGSLAAVRILLEAGADPNVRDRWGHLPVDDARKAHAMPVVEFLQQLAAAMADTEAAATPGTPGLAQGGSSLEQPGSAPGPGAEPVGLSLLNRSRKRRTHSALSLDAQAIAQMKAAQREQELARSMSGGSALSTPRAVTRQQSKASHSNSPVPTLATPSAMKHSPSTGRPKSVMLQTDSEQRREAGEEGSGMSKFAEAAAMPASAPAEDSVASADLAAVSAMLRGASEATAFVSEASQPVFADEAPLFALDDFAMFAERLKEEKEYFERGLSQALSQASELQDGLGQEASQPAIQGTGEGAQGEQARQAQQAQPVEAPMQAPAAWPTTVKLPANPAQATLDSTETSSSASSSSPPGERGGEGAAAAAGQGKGREEDDALLALTAAAQALAVGHPDGGAAARTSAAGPPPRTSSPTAAPTGTWAGSGSGIAAAPSMRRSDSPVGRSPLGRTPVSGSPPPATAAPLGGRPALNPAEGVRPSTSAVAGMGMGPIPAVLPPDPGRRPNTQPAIGPPGAGPLGTAPPAGSPEPQGGAVGDQPARPGSPLSFHMAQLMESMVHRAPEGSRRFSVMSQASSGRPSAGPQLVHWRDSPLFGSDEEAQQQP